MCLVLDTEQYWKVHVFLVGLVLVCGQPFGFGSQKKRGPKYNKTKPIFVTKQPSWAIFNEANIQETEKVFGCNSLKCEVAVFLPVEGRKHANTQEEIARG